MVIRFVEMFPHCFPVSLTADVIKVTLETLRDAPISLAHILCAALFACDQIDQIVAFACDIF